MVFKKKVELLSVLKCKLLSVNGSISRNYYINTSDAGYTFDTYSSETDIGVAFDSSLEFDQHISEKNK